MSDKPSDDKERPRSSIFGSRSDEKKEEEKKPEDRPSPFGGRPTGSIFGKPSTTSTFGRPTPMPPKPATSTGSTPKPTESKPASSIFGTRTAEAPKVEEAKPADPPKPASKPADAPKPEEKKPGGIFSGFGRKPTDSPKPESASGDAPKPEEKKPGGIFGSFGRKPADPPKPESPSAAPKPEEKKAGGLFSGFGRKPADAPKPESASGAAPKPEEKKAGGFLSALRKPADPPKPESASGAAPKPEEKKAGGFLSALRKPADSPKPAPPVDAPKIGTGKPAEKPRGGMLGGAKPAEKPAEPAAKPEPAKPAEQKPPEPSRKRGFWSLFKGSSAPSSEAGTPLKTPAPPDPKRGGSSVPGAPPARGEKQAKPLEGQTHVTVKNVGLSLDQKLDIVGWLLIGTGVVMIFGLIQPDEGTFTKAIVDIFGALFGYGRYLIPIPCLAVGGWLLLRYFKENPFLAFNALQMTGAALLFLSIVTWLHTIELIDKIVYDWDELIAVSARAVDLMQGGGWVGDRLYMILIRLTGEFGVPVVLTITTLVGALWFFELSLAEIAVYIKSVFQITGARLRRIGESWRAWRRTVATRRAARAAVRAELRAQRQAAKLAAQAQQQPQPTAGLPAAATLATAEMLSRQPISVPVDAEGQPPARKTAFRTPVVVPAVPVSETPAAASEDAAPPVPAIAKPSPLGARGAAAKKRSTAQPSPFSAPLGAAPAAEAPPEPKTTGVFSSPFGKPAQPEPTAPAAAAESATPEPPPEPPKRTTFGGIFGGKPKSEPSAAPSPETTAPAAAAESATPEPPKPPAEPPKRTSFGGIFGGKPKSEPSAAPQAESTAPAASTESVMTAPAAAAESATPEPPKRTTFGGIFGSKPKSEPSAAPSPETTAPAAAAESATPEPPKPPAEPPKRTSFGGIFGGKPKSEPSAAPSPETTAPAASTESVTTAPAAAAESATAAPPAEPPKRTTFGGIFGGKPKSEPSAAPQAEATAPAASTESVTAAPSPEPPKPPAESPKRTSFGSIFGGKPKSEPSAAPPPEATAPAAATESVTTAPSDPEITQPTRTTSIFSTPRPAPKPSDSKPAAPPEDAEAEDDAPSAKAPPPPKPSSSIFGSRASSPFSSPSAFRPAPKPSAASPAPEEAAPQADDDELKYVPEPDAVEDDAEAAHAPSAAAAPRIFGNFTPAKATESPAAPVPAAELPPMQLPPDETSWQMPDYRELLHAGSAQTITEEMLDERRRIIEETLEAFGAPGRVVEINVGPAITQFGVEPGYLSARGKQTRIKVNQIAKLDADLALALAARSIRIEAPVPGKGYVGIEVPNPETSLVGLRDIIASPAFNQVRSRLRLALGKSIDGAAVVADLTQMPHLLIAGTTGSGKSVCVNAIIACLLLQNAPDHLKLIMVDPKRVELTGYNGIPHLVSPVVVDLERVTGVLKWVSREMDDRYKKFAALGARNITDYNSKLSKAEPRLPYLVVIIDELADLMMLAPDETEKQLTRLAQMARATGIHLVISTQRPSVDVVTGLIKANFPARISFAVASSVDSRVILDQPGAEKLLGRGDMLYQAPDAAAPIRVQGVYVSDAELKQITDFWKNAQKERGTPLEAVSFDHAPDRPTAKLIKPGESAPFQSRTERFGSSPFGTPRFAPPRPKPSEEEEKFFAALRDEPPKETKVDEALYERAVELYKQLGAALNVSALQRRLNVDYTQAQSLYKLMRERGVLNADNGEHGADA